MCECLQSRKKLITWEIIVNVLEPRETSKLICFKNTMQHMPCDAGGQGISNLRQSVCATRALCIPKAYGPSGQQTDFCSCEYSRMMLVNNDDGTCRLTPNSYVVFVVIMLMVAFIFVRMFWSLYMLYVSHRSKVLKFNSLSLALAFNFATLFLVGFTILARNLTMIIEGRREFDLMNQIFNLGRVCSPIAVFGILTTLGMSIYMATLQTLQVPMDDRMEKTRKAISVGVVLLFCGVVLPFVAIQSYLLGSLVISILSVVCWWPFKRLGRRLRNGFPIAHLPAAYRERSFAVSEHLRIATNRILYVLYLRVLAAVFMIISYLVRRDVHNQRLFRHFEAFSDCFNAVSATVLVAVITTCLTVMVRVRLESAMNLQAIAMLVANSPRTEVATITIITDLGIEYSKPRV
jgi:hypothetical protein